MILLLTLGSLQAQDNDWKERNLTPDALNDFQQRTLVKINDLQDYIAQLADRKTDSDVKELLKEMTLKLFVREGAGVTMEVSFSENGNERRLRRPMSVYLGRLATLDQYAKVKITSSQSCYISRFLKKGIDEKGNSIYTATATIFQKFVGFNAEGQPVYEDMTKKTFEIEIKKIEELTDSRWIILLGDVSVSETTI